VRERKREREKERERERESARERESERAKKRASERVRENVVCHHTFVSENTHTGEANTSDTAADTCELCAPAPL